MIYLLKSILVKHNESFSKMLFILCFLLLSSALVLAHNTPATGYEPSIYKSTPFIIWIYLLLSIIIGSSVVISQVYFQKVTQSYFWIIGMILIYLCYIFIISLFIIRGYYSWCLNGDAASHIGDVYNILATGHLSNELFYPIIHIYTTQLSLVGGFNIILLHKIIPLFFGCLYVPFMYLFSKSVLQNKYQVLIATLASFTFINVWYINFTPNTLSNLFFPLLLYCTIKLINGKVVWEILILIMALLCPVFHPIPAMVLVLVIISLLLPSKLFFKFRRGQNNQKLFLLPKTKYTLCFVLFIWGITWISSFYVWEMTLVNLHHLVVEGGTSHLNELISQINYAESYGYSTTELILKKLGGAIAYILLALLSIPIILKKMITKPNDKKLNLLFSLYGPLSVIGVFLFFSYLLNLGFGPFRFLVYITLITTPFVGFYLTTTMIKFKQKKKLFFPFIITLFIVGIFVNGILTVYPSPYVFEMSQQTTKNEFIGMNWLFGHRNTDIQITGISAAPHRFNKLLPPSEIKRQNIPDWNIPNSIKPPSNHFGYNSTNSEISTYYTHDVYFPILDKDKSIYVDIFPEMAKIRWTLEDFEKLNEDVTVSKIYSSKSFELLYIYGMRK